MILVHCESLGYNVEPTIERLSPAWAKFKAESIYYSKAISPAPSTLMVLCGVFSGQHPAYSFQRVLTDSYLPDMRRLGGTWLMHFFPNKVAIAPSSVMLANQIGFDTQMTDDHHGALRNALAGTPKPRLIFVYIPDWRLSLGPIHDGVMSVEEAYLDQGTDVAREASIFDILPRDELVVVYGDHGNTWSCLPIGHAVNVDWDTIRAPIAIRYPNPCPEVINRLVSHLDLSLIIADYLGVQWAFTDHSFEHGTVLRELAYTRTCFALQGRMTPEHLWEYPPLVSVTDGYEQVVLELPITERVGPMVAGSLSYFEEGIETRAPSGNQESMAESLVTLETTYRGRALKLCGSL